MKQFLENVIQQVACFISDHAWKRVGKHWAEVCDKCIHCGVIGWRYSDDVTYKQHIIAQIKREAGIPDYAAKTLLQLGFDDDMRDLKSYNWTDDDTVAFAKILSGKRKKNIDERKTVSGQELMQQVFIEYIIPKLSNELDYRLAKNTLAKLLAPADELNHFLSAITAFNKGK